jgi:hypothetical protein
MDNLANGQYKERRKFNYIIIDMGILEENLMDYRNWLIKTNRVDKIGNYQKYLKTKYMY